MNPVFFPDVTHPTRVQGVTNSILLIFSESYPHAPRTKRYRVKSAFKHPREVFVKFPLSA
jgi:hypothetical protein